MVSFKPDARTHFVSLVQKGRTVFSCNVASAEEATSKAKHAMLVLALRVQDGAARETVVKLYAAEQTWRIENVIEALTPEFVDEKDRLALEKLGVKAFVSRRCNVELELEPAPGRATPWLKVKRLLPAEKPVVGGAS
jgi:hypothetical protein